MATSKQKIKELLEKSKKRRATQDKIRKFLNTGSVSGAKQVKGEAPVERVDTRGVEPQRVEAPIEPQRVEAPIEPQRQTMMPEADRIQRPLPQDFLSRIDPGSYGEYAESIRGGAKRLGGAVKSLAENILPIKQVGKTLGQMVGADVEILKAANPFKNRDTRTANPIRDIRETAGNIVEGYKRGGEVGQTFPGKVLEGLVEFPGQAAATAIEMSAAAPKVIVGKEEDFVNIAANSYMKQFAAKSGGQPITIEQARNYLLTGNFEGDINNINDAEVAKAWFSAMTPIGIELWAIADMARQAISRVAGRELTTGVMKKAGDSEAYRVLGLPEGASKTQIQKAFRDFSHKYHPDKFAMESPEIVREATLFYQKGANAYGYLKKSVKPKPSVTPTGTKPEPIIRTEPDFSRSVATRNDAPLASVVRPQISTAAPITDTLIKQLSQLKGTEEKITGRKEVSSERLKKLTDTIKRIESIKKKQTPKKKEVQATDVVPTDMLTEIAKEAHSKAGITIPKDSYGKITAVELYKVVNQTGLGDEIIAETIDKIKGLGYTKLGQIDLTKDTSNLYRNISKEALEQKTTPETKLKVDSIFSEEATKLKTGQLVEQDNVIYRITQEPWYANNQIHTRVEELTSDGRRAGKSKVFSFTSRPKTALTAPKKLVSPKPKPKDSKPATAPVSSQPKAAETREERRLEAIKGMNSKDAKTKKKSGIELKAIIDEIRKERDTGAEITKIEDTETSKVERVSFGGDEELASYNVPSGVVKTTLKNKLKDLLSRGKDENYFRDLSFKAYEDFMSGKKEFDESDIIDNFVDKNFTQKDLAETKSGDSVTLKSRIFPPLSTVSTSANMLDNIWQKKGLGDKIWDTWKSFALKLMRLKVGGEMSPMYPLEFIFGVEKGVTMYPYKVKIRAKKAEMAEIAYEIGERLKTNYTEAEREVIMQNILNAKYDKRATDKLQKEAFDIETKFAFAGQNLVKDGILPEESFREFLGRYLPGYYNKIESEKMSGGTTQKFGLDRRYTKAKRDGWQLSYREKRKLIKKKFDTKDARDTFATELEGKGIRYKKTNPLTQKYIDEKLGGRKDLIYTVKAGLTNELVDHEKALIFNEIAKDERIAREDMNPKEGFVKQLPDNKNYGDLAGMYIHQNSISDIKGLVKQPESEHAFLRGIMSFTGKSLSFMKASKTILDSAVSISNVINNFWLMDMAGVPMERIDYHIRNLVNALPALIDPHKGKGAYKELRRAGVTGQTMMREITDQAGINAEIERLSDILVRKKNGTSIDLYRTVTGLVRKGYLTAGELYSFTEDVSKSTVYEWNRKELGKTHDEAIDAAQHAIIDYGQVSDLLQILRKMPLGPAFTTFSAKVIPLLAETVVRKPFTVLKYKLLMAGAVTAALGTLSGVGVSDKKDVQSVKMDDINKLKGNLSGDWYLPLDITYNKSGDIEDIVIVDISRQLPWGKMTSPTDGFEGISDFTLIPKVGTWGTTMGAEEGMISAFQPGGLAWPPVQNILANRDPFTDKEIYDKRDSLVEQGRDQYNYLQKGWGPGLAPSLLQPADKGGYMYEALAKAFLNDGDLSGYSYRGEKKDKSETLLRLAGVKIVHIRPEEQNKFKEIAYYKEIDEIRKDIRSLTTKTNNIISELRAGKKEGFEDRVKRAIADEKKQKDELEERKAIIEEERDDWTDWYNDFMDGTKIK